METDYFGPLPSGIGVGAAVAKAIRSLIFFRVVTTNKTKHDFIHAFSLKWRHESR